MADTAALARGRWFRQPALSRIADECGRVLPGLALTGVGVVAAVGVNRWVPAISPLTGAVLLGAIVRNVGLVPEAARPGTRWAARRLLRLGIVLLGLQLAIPEVLRLGGPALLVVVVVVFATFFGTRWLGDRLGVPPGRVPARRDRLLHLRGLRDRGDGRGHRERRAGRGHRDRTGDALRQPRDRGLAAACERRSACRSSSSGCGPGPACTTSVRWWPPPRRCRVRWPPRSSSSCRG